MTVSLTTSTMVKPDSIINVAALASEIMERIQALPDKRIQDLRALRREYSQRIGESSAKQTVELALKLLDRGSIDYRFVAYELVSHHRPALQSLGVKEIEQLGRGLDSWAAVDCFACYLSGPAWREHQIPDSLIHRWTRSPDRWRRRAALVSTVPLNNKARGGSGDASRTIDICRLLVNDRDDMVVKALSWALRELAKREPQTVRQFLVDYKDAIAALAAREVRNKLSTGLKNPRKIDT